MKGIVNESAGTGAVLLSLVTGAGAVAASSCCALPLALSVAGFGGTWLGGLTQLAFYRPYVLAVAAIAPAAGWIAMLRPRHACGGDGACARLVRRRGGLTLGVLALSTLLVGAAVVWDWIEPAAMTALFRLVEGTA